MYGVEMGCYSNRLVAGSSLVFHHYERVSLVHNLPTFLSCKVQKPGRGLGTRLRYWWQYSAVHLPCQHQTVAQVCVQEGERDKMQ